MTGLVKSALSNGRSLSAVDALRAAAERGADSLLFNSLFDISPTLSRNELNAARAEADRLGLQISSMLGVLNPALPFRCELIERAGNGDLEAGVKHLVRLAAEIGIHDLFFVIGMIEDRFHEAVSWQDQRRAVADMVLRCAPVLRECKSRLLVKTHEEITTSEVVSLVETVGPDLLGIAFDPVNVVCRLEDPVAAARRVAPYAAQVHVDDAILRFQEGGFRRFLAPVGEGVLDWDAILALMPQAKIWIEMHVGQFAMPVFDPTWLRAQPEIELTEFASVMAMAAEYGKRDVPWDQNAPAERLPAALQKFQLRSGR